MRTILYIATSIDGFIADKNGGIDFLDKFGGVDCGYEDFIKDIDIVVMGKTTYLQVLSFSDDYVYKDKKTVVFSSNIDLPLRENVEVFSGDIDTFYSGFRNENIWIVGGGKLVKHFVQKNRIDEYRIFNMPIILGQGIKLFDDILLENCILLKLEEVKKYSNGIVELIYKK